MNELDPKSRESPTPDEVALLGSSEEPSLGAQVRELFQGRLGWVSVLVAVVTLPFLVFAIVSVVFFFRADSEKEMIAWAGGFGLGLIAISFSRLWFWLLLHRNAVLRELRRVELQVARLTRQLKTPA
jgi:hypothetical protein